jgi:hypothetical protein
MVVVLIRKEQSLMYIIMPLYQFGLFGKREKQINKSLPTIESAILNVTIKIFLLCICISETRA